MCKVLYTKSREVYKLQRNFMKLSKWRVQDIKIEDEIMKVKFCRLSALTRFGYIAEVEERDFDNWKVLSSEKTDTPLFTANKKNIQKLIFDSLEEISKNSNGEYIKKIDKSLLNKLVYQMI